VGFALQFKKSPPNESVELVSILVPEGTAPFTLGNEDSLAVLRELARAVSQKGEKKIMTHPLYTPSTARSPKVISFEPLQRGADVAEAAIRAAEDQLVAAMKAEEARAALYAKRDQLIEEQLRAKFKFGRLGSGEVA
jgi:hypothetical protein